MFTGIVTEVGRVARIDEVPAGHRIRIEAPATSRGLARGGSVAVDGVCLTVMGKSRTGFSAQIVPETARRSTLGALRRGGRVNLERPLRAGEEIGGHFVQGHVDATARVAAVSRAGKEVRLAVQSPVGLRKLIVEKGSIAINGVSLTVASLARSRFTVALIPTTLEATNLGALREGDPVNLEVDVIGKYVRSLLGRAGRR